MVQYFKDENSMFYASYSDGFKSGGYEALGTALANNGLYGSEGVYAYEFGYKTSSEKMKLSVNYFHSEYDGNQLSSFIYPEDSAPYNTTNNVPSTNKGLELELSYLLSDSLIADLSFTQLDATYDEYAGGTCALGATPVAGTSSCDYTGLPLLYAADTSGLFSLTSENEMSNIVIILFSIIVSPVRISIDIGVSNSLCSFKVAVTTTSSIDCCAKISEILNTNTIDKKPLIN